MSKLVTAEYLMGIKEGRSFLKSNPDTTKQEMKEIIESLSCLISSGFDKILKDTFKGERDFWKNQITV